MGESADFMASETDSSQSGVLWDYALERYARDGVAECCVALQDEAGANVLLIIVAAYLAERGIPLTGPRVQTLVNGASALQDSLIEPLRALRRANRPPDGEACERQRDTYQSLKQAELAAERWQLAQLAELVLPWNPEQVPTRQLLQRNIRAVAGAAEKSMLDRLVRALRTDR